MSDDSDYINLSESLQDYLKIILDLISEKHVARIKEIAQRKSVSMPSVTEAMQRLSQEGYVKYSVREFIELTEKGKKAANYFANRNIFLKNFLRDILYLPEESVNKEACALEHHLNDQTLEKFILLYQFLASCPKRDAHLIDNFKKCLKAAEGLVPDDPVCQSCFIKETFPHYHKDRKTIHTLLSEMRPGQKGRIIMLGPDIQARRDIIGKGLLPGIEITMERVSDNDSPVLVSSAGYSFEIEPSQARLIEIAIENSSENETVKSEKAGSENMSRSHASTNHVVPLSMLSSGQKFRIFKVRAVSEIRRRLVDMGFVKGEEGSVIREALLRDPIEIEIKGTMVSLRRSEARLIDIEVIE